MKKFELSKAVKNAKTSMSKHSPEILTGIGIAGMIGTTIVAVRATPKALKLLEAEKELKQENGEELSKADVVRTAWKCYIPAAVTGTVSIVCLIGVALTATMVVPIMPAMPMPVKISGLCFDIEVFAFLTAFDKSNFFTFFLLSLKCFNIRLGTKQWLRICPILL